MIPEIKELDFEELFLDKDGNNLPYRELSPTARVIAISSISVVLGVIGLIIYIAARIIL